MTAAQKLVQCPLCNHQDFWLGDHLVEAHQMSIEKALDRFPNLELESEALVESFNESQSRVRRKAAPSLDNLYVQYGHHRFQVNHDVDPKDCLVMPPAYRLPTHGKLGKDVVRALRYFAAGRNTYIYGLPGSGKDALFHALCASTRRPSAIYQINPNTDIMSWLHTRSLDSNGTFWEEGPLLRQLRDGYTTSTGRKVPYTILLSDFDRAARSQAEAVRLILDSIEGRISGPTGETYPLFPGTQIVATANTMGAGDEHGRMVSSNIIDGSILDRFERKCCFHTMDWEDEVEILQSKFPLFMQKCSDLLDSVKESVKALRKAVEDMTLYGEFSHRGLCAWLEDAEDILRITPKVPRDLLKQSFMTVADSFPDKQTRIAALRLIDAHLTGGAVPRGDTSGIDPDDLDL